MARGVRRPAEVRRRSQRRGDGDVDVDVDQAPLVLKLAENESFGRVGTPPGDDHTANLADEMVRHPLQSRHPIGAGLENTTRTPTKSCKGIR